MVVKKDGSRESFNRGKILAGLVRACEKRPVPLERLEALVNDVEKDLQSSMEQEVTSARIGEMVMERLRPIDEVAYVRFASVYREFKDISKFMQEIEKLIREP